MAADSLLAATPAAKPVARFPRPCRATPADPFAQRRVALHRAIYDRAVAQLASGATPGRDRAIRSLIAVARSQLPCFNLRLIQSGDVA